MGFSDENLKAAITKKCFSNELKILLKQTKEREISAKQKMEEREREREPKRNCRMKMKN